MTTVKHGLGLKTLARAIAKDERLHPNKRVLTLLILAHLDGHDWALDIIKSQYGTSSRVVWKGPDEENVPDSMIEREAKETIREIFGAVEAATQNADSSPTSRPSGS